MIQSHARWIWTSAAEGSPANAPNQYVDFRATFELPEARPSRRALLRVSVDTNFAAWINGQLAGCGQFTDFPNDRTYSEMDVSAALRAGSNALAIGVHYCGVDHFSYLPGDAGLWFELECDGQIVLASDGRTLCRASRAYQRNLTARFNEQMGFTFNFDAAGDDDWRDADYRADEEWKNAAATSEAPAPRPRPLKMLDLRPRAEARIVAQGLLKRVAAAEDQTLAQGMQSDFLSARRPWELFDDCPPISSSLSFPAKLNPAKLAGADGAYVLLDLGREECGLIELELNATGACTIDIAVGEHVDDLRVRSSIGGRNFSSRYVTRAGRQTFTHFFNRYAGRYVQLHITNLGGGAELIYAGLRPTDYPVQFTGQFCSSDSLCNEIFNTARRTLHLCMHEHYEDCPWREQALYANDSRNQMLCGYYAFGDRAFARESLNLLSRTTGDDAYQELCAPMKCAITIPSFTLVWFLAMNDYLMYSGDRAFIAEKMPLMKRMLRRHLSTVHDGLLPCPVGKRYWQFYDWAAGLDGSENEDCRKFAVADQPRFDAPLNFYFVLALEAVENMARWIDDDFSAECREQAQIVKSASQRAFWDAKRQAFVTYLGRSPHFAELTQSLAILAGAGNQTMRRELRAALMRDDNGMVPTTLSQSLYKFEAILQDETAGEFVRDRIAGEWSKMLFAGATSFWETRAGGWDFHHAGSLCHGWSGIPVYFYGAYGLGIKPLDPGFARIGVKPLLGFDRAGGTVPTPRGEIRLDLRRRDDGIYGAHLRSPGGMHVNVDRALVDLSNAGNLETR